MDPLPGKGLVRAFNVGAQGSMQAAAAPYAALGGVGEAIANIGEKGAQLIVKHQQLAVQRKEADMELEFDQLQQEYELEVLKNPNMTPEEAIAGWQKRVQPFQSKYQADGMSPMERDVLSSRSKQLASKGEMGVAKSSFMASIQNTKQSAINLIARGEQTGNDEMRQNGFKMLGQVVPEADIEAERMKSDGRVMTTQVESEIAANPIGMREKLKDPNFVKEHPGVSVDDIPRLQDQARSGARQALGDSLDEFSDGVATGKVKSPEDVDRLYSNRVPPRVIEQMKSNLAERWDATKKLERAQPAYQNGVVGKVSSMLEDFTAEDSDYDEKYVEMDSLIRTLPPGAAKDELSRQLGAVRTGQFNEQKTLADMGRDSLSKFYKGGGFGRVRKDQGTSAAVDSGLLRDRDKLAVTGLSSDSLEYITGKNAKGEYTDEGKKLSDTERRRRFLEKYPQRIDKKTAADPFLQSAFEAIQRGKDTVSWTDADAEKKAIKAYGEARTKLEDWIRASPEHAKDPEKLAEKIYSLASPHGLKQATTLILTEPPAWDDAPPPEEDMTPLPPTSSRKDTRIDDPLQIAAGPGGSSDSLLPPLSVR